jgi:DNA-binding transcriptional LysR family regulator
MLDLGRLRALHAVDAHGSVAAAAQALGYTPSAVSQQITKLERETGTTLLERRGRGVALTDAAHLLVDAAGRVLGIVEEAEVALEERRGRPAGQLGIAAFPTAARGLLPPVLAELAARHPALDLFMTEEDPHLAPSLVARGVIDLAVVHDWDIAPLPLTEGLTRTPLGEDRCDLLLPRDHPLAGRDTLTREDVAGERWIVQPPGSVCHDWLMRTLRACGTEPRVVCHVAEYDTQVALVAAGFGIALVPRLGRGPLPDQVRVRPLDPAPVRGLYALWRTTAARRPAIAEALRLLRSTAAAQRHATLRTGEPGDRPARVAALRSPRS